MTNKKTTAAKTSADKVIINSKPEAPVKVVGDADKTFVDQQTLLKKNTPLSRLPFFSDHLQILLSANIVYVEDLKKLTISDLLKNGELSTLTVHLIETVFNNAGYELAPPSNEHHGNPYVYPTKKSEVQRTAEDIANDLEESKIYLNFRREDCDKLCKEIAFGKERYYKIVKHENAGLVFYSVVDTNNPLLHSAVHISGDAGFFTSRNKECILAYILAKFW